MSINKKRHGKPREKGTRQVHLTLARKLSQGSTELQLRWLDAVDSKHTHVCTVVVFLDRESSERLQWLLKRQRTGVEVRGDVSLAVEGVGMGYPRTIF